MAGIPSIVSSGRMTLQQYRYLHEWVRRHRGTPKECELCGKNDPSKVYDWANISQEYRRDLSDWRRLCRPCHALDRDRTHCRNGHELTPENIYTNPADEAVGYRECRTCRSALGRARRAKVPRKLTPGFCRRGHPQVEENLSPPHYYPARGKSYRRCRPCERIKWVRMRERKRLKSKELQP